MCYPDYDYELKYYNKLKEVIEKKYKNINYIICFIIPNQDESKYYKKLDDKIFLFTIKDITPKFPEDLNIAYEPIITFILENNLFLNTPEDNEIDIQKRGSQYWTINNYPMVNYIEK